MKKYPFSKKAVSLMLATALVVTPLASAVPVGGNVVSAASLSEQEINDKIETLSGKVFNFYEHADNVSVSPISWEADFYPPYIKTLGADDARKLAYKRVIEAITNIIYKNHSNATSIANDIKSFRSNRSADLQTVFNDDNDVITDKLLLFFEKLEAKINSESFLLTAVGTSYSSAVSTAVGQVISDNSELASFDGKLNTHLGTGVAGMFDIQALINNQIDSNKAARSALISSAVTSKQFDISYTGTVGLNNTLNLKFLVTSASIPNGVDIANSLDWEYKLNNGSFQQISFTSGEGFNLNLSQYGTYTVRAKLLNDDLVISTKTISMPDPSSGDTGTTPPPGGGITPPADGDQDDDQDPIEPVDIDEDAKTVETVVRDDGRSSQVVTVDAEKLTESIKNVENVDRVRITVETAKGEVAEVRVPVKAFTAVSERNANAQVEIATKEASYRLPVKEVNVENLAKELGVEATDDVSISVQISEVEDSSDSITKGNLKSVAPIMEFKVVASSGDKSVEMRRFSSFVEREIVGENDFNPKSSTAVQLMDDGTFRSVPTIFNGNRAVFRSLTNSRYTVVENDKTFTDLEEVKDWAGEEIEKLASKYIIQGFNENEFKPMGDTTRGQLVALLTRALGLTTDSEYGEQFEDVKATHTFAAELTAALEAGIIEGFTDNTFKPEDVVTREQAAAMFARALRHIGFDESKLDDKDLSYFVDANSVNSRFNDDVELLLQSGIMVGGTDQNFRPENINNRAQTAKVLDNFLKFINFIN